MNIKLTLIKPLIIEAVKNETFHKGQVDKAVDQKAIAAAYHEQAGDDTYHERILDRAFYTYLAELKSLFSDYLTAAGQTSADNVRETTEGDNVILTLSVTDRFNQSYTDPLAKLSAEYITNSMLMDWWRHVNERQSALYTNFLERNIIAIKRCFNKTAPIAPTTPYTTSLDIPGTAIDICIGEHHTVSYTLSGGAIDDIEARVSDKRICAVERSAGGFVIVGKQIGHAHVEVYSRHNTELATTIHVYVSDHS